MSFLTKLSNSIEEQNWDHSKFLRNLLLMLTIVILFFYIFIFSLYRNGVVSQQNFQNTLNSLLQGNILGIIFGVIINFLYLLRYYLKKQWDLHIIVPSGLLFHLFLSVCCFIFFFFTEFLSVLLETSLLVGLLLGGLIPILAYSGEVEKEHSEL